jgi:hypothetical protein
MTNSLVTAAESTFCMYKLGMEGSFTTSLINTIFKADTQNRILLAKGYPEIVEVCNNFNNTPGYWKDLQKRWNESHVNHQLKEYEH